MSDTTTSSSMQSFLVEATKKQAEQLEAAMKRIPEDKRDWSPMGNARSAMDQYAECAILTGSTAKLIKVRSWDNQGSMDDYFNQKNDLAKDYNGAKKLMAENLPKIAEAIESVQDKDLDVKVDMPWGPMALKDIISYPYWNMSYHEGQINYIASMLGTLE